MTTYAYQRASVYSRSFEISRIDRSCLSGRRFDELDADDPTISTRAFPPIAGRRSTDDPSHTRVTV